MNIFEMILNADNENVDGVYAISLVNTPAFQMNMVKLSSEELLLKVQDKSKHIVTGPLMIPNKLITRYNKDTKEPYQIYFSENTIEETSQDFLKNFKQKNATIEHMLDVDNVSVVESWLVIDAENDKAKSLGFDVPKGTWMTTLKIDDEELWDGLIKTDLLNGLSLEGTFEPKEMTQTELSEIKDNTKYMDKKEKNVIAAIRELFLGKETEVELEAVAEVSKWWMDLVDGTTFELGSQLMRKPYEDGGEAYPLSAGEYELEDGRKVLTDAEGIIRYIFGDEPEVVEEPAVEPDAVDEPVDETVEASAQTVETEAPVETPEAVVETPAVPTVADVIDKIKTEVEPQLVPHTDAPNVARKAKIKFDNKLTVQERIKQRLGTL